DVCRRLLYIYLSFFRFHLPSFLLQNVEGESSKYQLPFLGEIPLIQGIRESGDMGQPSVANQEDEVTATAFATLAEHLAQQIAIRNAKAPLSTAV
ncbi:MAG: hypothetical protein AAF734_08290, partial [Bacteroidota bacterium]